MAPPPTDLHPEGAKLRLAVAFTVVKTQPRQMTVAEYVAQLRTKLDKALASLLAESAAQDETERIATPQHQLSATASPSPELERVPEQAQRRQPQEGVEGDRLERGRASVPRRRLMSVGADAGELTPLQKTREDAEPNPSGKRKGRRMIEQPKLKKRRLMSIDPDDLVEERQEI